MTTISIRDEIKNLAANMTSEQMIEQAVQEAGKITSSKQMMVEHHYRTGCWLLICRAKDEVKTTWSKSCKKAKEKLNCKQTTLDNCMMLARFDDTMEYGYIGVTKLMKLTNTIHQFWELMAKVRRKNKVTGFYSIEKTIDFILEKNAPVKDKNKNKEEEKENLKNNIIKHPSSLYLDAVKIAAIGTEFDGRFEEVKHLSLREAKEMIEELRVRDIDSDKVEKFISEHTTKKIDPKLVKFHSLLKEHMENLKKFTSVDEIQQATEEFNNKVAALMNPNQKKSATEAEAVTTGTEPVAEEKEPLEHTDNTQTEAGETTAEVVNL